MSALPCVISQQIDTEFPLGFWKSKETDLIAELVKVDDEIVWYVIPQWNGWQHTTKEVWLGSMSFIRPV